MSAQEARATTERDEIFVGNNGTKDNVSSNTDVNPHPPPPRSPPPQIIIYERLFIYKYYAKIKTTQPYMNVFISVVHVKHDAKNSLISLTT